MNDNELALFLADATGKRLLQMREGAAVDPLDLAAVQSLEKSADAQANEFLIDQLAQLRPDDAVLSEESPDSSARLSAERVWIIDPVDGSKEFARSKPEFAVHVALWERGELKVGAVAIPNHDVVWTTADVVQTSNAQRLDRPLVIATSNREPQQNVELLERHMAKYAEKHGYPGAAILHCGSVGGKVHQLLSGVADVYASSVGFYEWDSAAPTVVATHHGLAVCDFDGNALVFNKMPPRTESFIVTHPWLQQTVLRAVQDFS